jgi:hypothetical protein
VFGNLHLRRSILPSVGMTVLFATLLLTRIERPVGPSPNEVLPVAPEASLPELTAPAAVTLPPPPERALSLRSATVLQTSRQTISETPALIPLTPASIQPNSPVPSLAGTAPAPTSTSQDRADETLRGRSLLKVLESGSGPSVEIAWPNSGQDRERLFQILQRCHGMRSALMTASGRLLAVDGPPGAAWQPNLDLFSGFVRAAAGVRTKGETKIVARIRVLHGSIGSHGELVRLFPREVDARMLGRLYALVGRDYLQARHITAAYHLKDGQAWVGDLRVDGQSLDGRIDLIGAGQC